MVAITCPESDLSNNEKFNTYYILHFYDNRYASSSQQSPQKSSLNLEMPLGQGQDGKPFLNFGKK